MNDGFDLYPTYYVFGLEQQNAALLEALKAARSAVITLKIDALGWSYTDNKQRYSLRDELLSNISKAIDDAEGDR